MKKLRFYCGSSWGPLKSFKQGNNMIQTAVLKDGSDSSVEDRKGRGGKKQDPRERDNAKI